MHCQSLYRRREAVATLQLCFGPDSRKSREQRHGDAAVALSRCFSRGDNFGRGDN